MFLPSYLFTQTHCCEPTIHTQIHHICNRTPDKKRLSNNLPLHLCDRGHILKDLMQFYYTSFQLLFMFNFNRSKSGLLRIMPWLAKECVDVPASNLCVVLVCIWERFSLRCVFGLPKFYLQISIHIHDRNKEEEKFTRFFGNLVEDIWIVGFLYNRNHGQYKYLGCFTTFDHLLNLLVSDIWWCDFGLGINGTQLSKILPIRWPRNSNLLVFWFFLYICLDILVVIVDNLPLTLKTDRK